MPIALCSCHIVLLVKSNVEPHGRVEGAVLVQAQPAQVTVKSLCIFSRIKVSIRHSPIGDGASHTVDQLPNRTLSFLQVRWITVKVLAHHDVRSKLAPVGRDLAIGLLKKYLSIFVLDRCAARLPFDGVKRVHHVSWAKSTFDFESISVATYLVSGS